MTTQNPLQWDISQQEKTVRVQLSGELTCNTLLPLWKQRSSFLSVAGHQSIIWDLASLTAIDSAGFTLFAELLNHYQKTAKNQITNAPQTLFSLVELFGLSAFFAPFLANESKSNGTN